MKKRKRFLFKTNVACGNVRIKVDFNGERRSIKDVYKYISSLYSALLKRGGVGYIKCGVESSDVFRSFLFVFRYYGDDVWLEESDVKVLGMCDLDYEVVMDFYMWFDKTVDYKYVEECLIMLLKGIVSGRVSLLMV